MIERTNLSRAFLVLGLATLSACGSTGAVVERTPAPPTSPPPLEHRSIGEQANESVVAEEVPEETIGASTTVPAKLPETTSGSADVADPKGEPIGRVAGTPIYAEDLLVEWHQADARQIVLLVDKVVTTRLAFAEAQRLSLRLSPEAVEERLAAEHQRLEDTVASFQLGLGVEDYLRSELGVEPQRYFERMRAATIRQMLAERVVRTWTLSNETVALRLIVVAEEATMREVQERLAEGADFGELAREVSVDDTAEQGGFVPYLVRQEHSPLARLAFATAVGELGGPLTTAEHQFLVRVEERRTQLAGDWNSIGAEVEASLAQYGLSDAEFVHWKLAMEQRYPIDLGRLQDIIGSERASR